MFQQHICEDWAPTSSGALDSQVDSQEDAENGVAVESDGHHQPPKEPVTSEPEGSMVYELNQIMSSLEENLPEQPFPGPEQPQILGDRTKGQELAKVQEPAPRPISTPCRGNESASFVEKKTVEDRHC